MELAVSQVAASVIRRADRAHPADAVLRSELREARQLTPAQRTEIARAVFDYYRWFGWLEPCTPLGDGLRRTADLARAFVQNPKKFSDSEFAQRSVPVWLSQFMEVTPAFARALQAPPKLWLRARRGQEVGSREGSTELAPPARYPTRSSISGTKTSFAIRDFITASSRSRTSARRW